MIRRMGWTVVSFCLLISACSLARSSSTGPWVNPPIAQKPRLDLTRLECQADGPAPTPMRWAMDATRPCPSLPPGTILFSTPTEATIGDLSVAFTSQAWEAFSEWVNRTYTDGLIRWRVLEEANRPK